MSLKVNPHKLVLAVVLATGCSENPFTSKLDVKNSATQLKISVVGEGKILAPEVTINCASNCSYKIEKNRDVLLNATASKSHFLNHWEGCTEMVGTGCKVLMDGDRQVTAFFEPILIIDSYDLSTVPFVETQGDPARGIDYSDQPANNSIVGGKRVFKSSAVLGLKIKHGSITKVRPDSSIIFEHSGSKDVNASIIYPELDVDFSYADGLRLVKFSTDVSLTAEITIETSGLDSASLTVPIPSYSEKPGLQNIDFMFVNFDGIENINLSKITAISIFLPKINYGADFFWHSFELITSIPQ